MRLDLWGYRVHAFSTLIAAGEYAGRPVDVIATTDRDVADEMSEYGNVLLFGTKDKRGPGRAQRYEPEGIPASVRETLRMMCARKRGPKKPVQSVPPPIGAFAASGTAHP